MLQNLPYSIHTKTQSCYFHFSFQFTLLFSLINALVRANMANFEAFHQVISSSINLLFLKSDARHLFFLLQFDVGFLDEYFNLSFFWALCPISLSPSLPLSQWPLLYCALKIRKNAIWHVVCRTKAKIQKSTSLQYILYCRTVRYSGQ